MAALSDYLESGLLHHIFFGNTFNSPSTVAIALTSGVPKESQSGVDMPELPSGIQKGLTFVSTNYNRLDLGSSSDGSGYWNNVGIDGTTAYQLYSSESGIGLAAHSGYFYPLYLEKSVATAASTATPKASFTLTFEDTFPNTTFYSPENVMVSGDLVTSNPGYIEYEGNGFIKNTNQLLFPTAVEEWGWVSGIAICDSKFAGSGNMLMYAQLTNPRYVYAGDTIKFDSNSLEISLR